jgi:hypothetical protein
LLLASLIYLLHALRKPNKRVFSMLKKVNNFSSPAAPK